MPAARYWRVAGVETYAGSDLELNDIALYAGGTRVDALAAFSSTMAPAAPMRWAGADVQRPGFAVWWDFGGAPQDVDAVLFGAVSQARFLTSARLEYSTDAAVWSVLKQHLGFVYQGDGLLQNVNSTDPLFPKVMALYNFDTAPRWSEGIAPVECTALQAAAPANSRWQVLSSGYEFSVPVPALPGDFCIEGRIAQANHATYNILRLSGSGYRLRSPGTGGYTAPVYLVDAAGNILVSVPGQALDTPRSYAWTREGATNRFFVDGVLRGTFTDATTHPAGVLTTAAASVDSSLAGWLYNLRVTVGAARYTAAYTPVDPLPGFAHHVTATPGTALRISAYTPPALTTKQGAPCALDLTFGGMATVTGTVKKFADPSTQPVARRVRLYDEQARMLARETWSDPATGVFTFTGVRADRRYTVVAMDHLGQYRAVAIDRVEAT